MNADRVQLSVAVLISIAVHGAIASFGDFPAGQAAAPTQLLPVTVTIVSNAETALQHAEGAATLPRPQQERRPQEPSTDVAEAAKTVVPVPTKAIPERLPQIQSSKSVSNADHARVSMSNDPVDAPPTPTSEPDRTRPIDAVASTKQPTNTSLANEPNDTGQAAVIKRLPVHEVLEVTAVPLYHLIPKPAYPSRSRDLGEEGLVIIAVLVSKDGSVLEAYVSESSGYPLLDGSALATVTEKWRFKPGRRSGEAIPSWVRVPIKFSIKGG